MGGKEELLCLLSIPKGAQRAVQFRLFRSQAGEKHVKTQNPAGPKQGGFVIILLLFDLFGDHISSFLVSFTCQFC